MTDKITMTKEQLRKLVTSVRKESADAVGLRDRLLFGTENFYDINAIMNGGEVYDLGSYTEDKWLYEPVFEAIEAFDTQMNHEVKWNSIAYIRCVTEDHETTFILFRNDSGNYWDELGMPQGHNSSHWQLGGMYSPEGDSIGFFWNFYDMYRNVADAASNAELAKTGVDLLLGSRVIPLYKILGASDSSYIHDNEKSPYNLESFSIGYHPGRNQIYFAHPGPSYQWYSDKDPYEYHGEIHDRPEYYATKAADSDGNVVWRPKAGNIYLCQGILYTVVDGALQEYSPKPTELTTAELDDMFKTDTEI